MIIDLTKSGFKNLSLIVSFEASGDVVSTACESVGFSSAHRSGEDSHYLELAAYRRGGRSYRVSARLIASAKGNSSLTLNYVPGEVRRGKGRRANLDKIGHVLDDLASPCSVVCLAHADVPTDRFKPIVGLPLLRFNMPHEYFDEVSGIRLTKLRSDGAIDGVVLEIHEESELHINADATYTTTLSANMALDALTRLANIRDHAVTQVQSET